MGRRRSSRQRPKPMENDCCPTCYIAWEELSLSKTHRWIFSIITPVFSVTWSLRNHSNMLIYYECWNCCAASYSLLQWFSNFLHQVPLQKIFGFPSTTIMTNIKMQYKWLPTAPGVCVCVCVHCCVCVHFGWVKCRAQIPSMSRHFHFQQHYTQ